MKDFKIAIEQSIKAFETGSLFEKSINLFQTLGYNTERQYPLNKPTLKEFEEEYIKNNPNEIRFNREKALTSDWKYIDLLFQLSKEEILKQVSLFDTKEFNKTIIESYLFIVIELSKEKYNRTTLANITREVNKLFAMPVMILFKHDDTLTLSVINRRLHEKDKSKSKDVLEKVTLIKDIRVKNTHRAHIEILFDLSLDELKDKYNFTNFVELHNAWQKTLDTKELNKRFFRELSNWFFYSQSFVKFPNENKSEESKNNQLNLIRLITRLIFVWFLKEKNLVEEKLFDANYIQKILNNFESNSEKTRNYYPAILQNLFFATLNQKMGDRDFVDDSSSFNKKDHGVKNLYRYPELFNISKNEVIKLFENIPFLNGGLFDCLDKDNEDTGKHEFVDGFTRNEKFQALVPDFLLFGEERKVDLTSIYGTKKNKEIFKGIIEIFKNYKFTIEENTPIEEEIALDPELLGKAFENLLAFYNPETATTARKQTGSFYTPREIVDYMVDESLIAYLKGQLLKTNPVYVKFGEMQTQLFKDQAENGQLIFTESISKSRWEGKEDELENELRELTHYNDKLHSFNEQEVQQLIFAIDHCKILDPACGSGAFPMGILHKLVYLLRKLDKEDKNGNTRWRELQKKKAQIELMKALNEKDKKQREEKLIEINETFENNASDFGRKLFLIENCIYGVDIQPIAIQISKLRFFISLIIDQNEKKGMENRGIRPLPNLETKFVAANTLIGLSGQMSLALANNEIINLQKELQEVRHKHFEAKTRKDKLVCQKRDKEIRKQISSILISIGFPNDEADKIADFDIYDQNNYANWFAPEWMFGRDLENKFDIVNGNPPYGVNFPIEEKEYFKKNYKHQDYQPESYLLFIEKSFDFIKDKAIISYIIPNTWLTNLKLIRIRRYLTTDNSILKIAHYHKSVFEAVVDTEVVIFRKGYIKHNLIEILNHIDINEVGILTHNQEKWKEKNGEVINIFATEKVENLVSKIKKNSSTIFELCNVVVGMKPYQVGKGVPKQDRNTVENRIFDAEQKIDKSYRKLLRGSDINKYENNWDSKRWIKFGEWLAEPRLSANFDAKEKIVIRQTGDSLISTLDINQFVCMNNLHVLSIKSNTLNLKYILALINSKLLNFYFQYLNPETGEALAEVKKETVEKLLIKKTKEQSPFIKLVDYVLIIKKSNRIIALFFERIIDAMVYGVH